MANSPPPYSDITGISRTVMKDNAQETLSNYDGNARPAEIVVNQTNSNVYIGNATGNLTQIWSPAVTLVPTYTASSAGNLVGAVGQIIAVTDSSGNAGRLAYWDGTNDRWSYVDTNGAV
jgi:hypothetical protein